MTMSTDWAKSSFSTTGSCLEARIGGGGTSGGHVQVRDSKDKTGPVLEFTPAEWEAFLGGARAGEFGHLAR